MLEVFACSFDTEFESRGRRISQSLGTVQEHLVSSDESPTRENFFLTLISS